MNARAITVGVDGSETARQAVRWAAREASRRGAPLVLVHAFDTMHLRRSAGTEMWIDDVEKKLAAESTAVLDQARADAAEIDSSVAVEADCRWDRADPAVALRAASRDALMVVLGWTGRGALGTALGSVTLAVASHAECPVVVVRGSVSDESRPVLVGVDGGPLSDIALAHAFDAASHHGDPLRALHVWTDADTSRAHLGTMFASPWETMREAEERALAERLAGWRERYPDVEVERVLERADPRKALVEQSGTARLVVVATRGRGGFAGLLLGSTGLALIQHADAPVMLVGPEAAHPA
ncbi:universal stress protein [Pseudonocardia nematodicida]|uniref:Universal stress protein n=1 Tax=Pseudonocardia nematodicida TaxID=1206997 RepID=A0ABV1KEZ7_9PSEU